MISSDVTSMYRNFPVVVIMLNIIKGYVKNDDQFTRKMAIPQDKFFDLVFCQKCQPLPLLGARIFVPEFNDFQLFRIEKNS